MTLFNLKMKIGILLFSIHFSIAAQIGEFEGDILAQNGLFNGDIFIMDHSPKLDFRSALGADIEARIEWNNELKILNYEGGLEIFTGMGGVPEKRMEITSFGSWNIGALVGNDIYAGSVILGDEDPDNEGAMNNFANDQFVARFKNGYYFMTSGADGNDGTPRSGVMVTPMGNAWSSICDRNTKENFEYLNDKEVLQKLSKVKFSSWNYKGQDPQNFRHYGIMAQDFHDLFGRDSFGTIGNDSLVNPIDMLGITMSALKGASQKIDKQQEEIENLRKELLAIKSDVLLLKSNLK